MYKIYFAFILFCCSLSLNAQNTPRFKVGVSVGMAYTGSLVYGDRYQVVDSSPAFIIKNTNPSRLTNYNFGVGYILSNSFSIIGIIGVAKYGFGYKVTVDSPGSIIFNKSGTYKSKMTEVSLSGEYHLSLSKDIQFIIQPGIAWYTNQGYDSQSLQIFQKNNNYSALLFIGVEIPISINRFYISAGLNTKIALADFGNTFSFDNKYHPYALGLQTTISYKFVQK